MNQYTKPIQNWSKEIKSDRFYHYKVGRVKTIYIMSNREKSNIAINEQFGTKNYFKFLGAPILFSLTVHSDFAANIHFDKN